MDKKETELLSVNDKIKIVLINHELTFKFCVDRFLSKDEREKFKTMISHSKSDDSRATITNSVLSKLCSKIKNSNDETFKLYLLWLHNVKYEENEESNKYDSDNDSDMESQYNESIISTDKSDSDAEDDPNIITFE